MFKTRITEMLGIEYPIVQAAMATVARAELVSAVSNAGGLGIVCALTFPSADELASEIRRIKQMTDKPFGVNFTLLPTLKPVGYEDYIQVAVEEGVKVVETSGKNPEPYMKLFKAAGMKVIHKCTAVRFAEKAESIGCDAVSIDGFECGGHPGEEDVTSLTIIPLTCDAVHIPVLASGGIGDARGFVAALALGAEGVNMGTRMLATQESTAHPRVKEWLLRASERDTMLIQRSLRNSRRVLRNSMAEKVAEMEKRGATLAELSPLIDGKRTKELALNGDLEAGVMSSGQVVGLVRDIPTVKELIQNIINEAEVIVKRLAILGSSPSR